MHQTHTYTIGILSPRYFPAIGGVERHAQALAEGLVQRGHNVEVITTDPTGQNPPQEIINGVLVRRFATLRNDNTLFISARLCGWLWQHAPRYALLHGHSYHAPLSLQAAIISALHRIPFVFSPHYHGTGHTPLRRVLHIPYGPAARWMIHQAQRIFCVSMIERDLLRSHFGELPYVLAPNGVEVDVLRAAAPHHPKEQQHLLLSVGRLEYYKHVDRLVQVLAHLPAHYRAVIIGKGDSRKTLEALAARLGVQDRVQFLGHVTEQELHSWYRTANIFIALSQHEAFGMTLLEAAAAGAYVVASDIPAHREVAQYINNEGITLVDPACNDHCLAQIIQDHMHAPRTCQPENWQIPTWQRLAETVDTEYSAIVSAMRRPSIAH